MFESCEGFGSRLRDIARCLSSNESLIWSARRRSCDGLDMAEVVPLAVGA